MVPSHNQDGHGVQQCLRRELLRSLHGLHNPVQRRLPTFLALDSILLRLPRCPQLLRNRLLLLLNPQLLALLGVQLVVHARDVAAVR